MSDKTRTFPLPLSSITDKSPAKKPVYNTVATPQTATQNAARQTAGRGRGHVVNCLIGPFGEDPRVNASPDEYFIDFFNDIDFDSFSFQSFTCTCCRNDMVA